MKLTTNLCDFGQIDFFLLLFSISFIIFYLSSTPDQEHVLNVLVFLIVLYVSSYRWVHFSRVILFGQIVCINNFITFLYPSWLCVGKQARMGCTGVRCPHWAKGPFPHKPRGCCLHQVFTPCALIHWAPCKINKLYPPPPPNSLPNHL